jgi:hypothetical protein
MNDGSRSPLDTGTVQVLRRQERKHRHHKGKIDGHAETDAAVQSHDSRLEHTRRSVSGQSAGVDCRKMHVVGTQPLIRAQWCCRSALVLGLIGRALGGLALARLPPHRLTRPTVGHVPVHCSRRSSRTVFVSSAEHSFDVSGRRAADSQRF